MDGFDEEALAEAYNRGVRLEKAGDVVAAAEAFRQALAIDPADHCGVAVRLAALRLAPTPVNMPGAYVTTLFDQHAGEFDEILVERLGYCVPLLLRDGLQMHAPGHYPRALDLGCGTGLSGVALADLFGQMTGVDLSEKMLEIAFDRGVYAELYAGEAVEFLQEFEDEKGTRPDWDLVVATDVFPYLGRIEPIIAGVAARMPSGGVFGFSTETLPAEEFSGEPFKVGAKRRFAHAADYISTTLREHGFEVLAMHDITVRSEEGAPVPGHLVLARIS